MSDASRRSYANVLEIDGQLQAAAEQFDGLVGKFDRESSGEFLMAAARCHRALRQPDESARRLQRVLDEYGETSHASIARIRLGELRPSAP